MRVIINLPESQDKAEDRRIGQRRDLRQEAGLWPEKDQRPPVIDVFHDGKEMVLIPRIELGTSPLPRVRSTY